MARQPLNCHVCTRGIFHLYKRAVIKDYGDAYESFRGKCVPEKSNGDGQTAVRTPKHLKFSCKAQGKQHEIRIVFFERDQKNQTNHFAESCSEVFSHLKNS